MAAPNHFLSVSRAGVLCARRRGEAPVEVATGAAGLEVALPPDRLAGVVTIRVFFAYRRATPRRSVLVTEVEIDGARVDVDAFLAAHGVAAEELGAWMRSAVERALDHQVERRL